MIKIIKSNLTVTFFCALGIMFLFSCKTKDSEIGESGSDSVSKNLILLNDSISFADYTIRKSYIDSLPRQFKLIVFQTEINGRELKLYAYYTKPGGGPPNEPQREYIRIPDSLLKKGSSDSLPFPFSIGNNQVRRDSIIRNPPQTYVNLKIKPIVEKGILIYKLEGLRAGDPSTEEFAPIPLGKTNPSPPATSF